ncbi:hypothetical protein CK203_063103 [Vitis vinifera]|uniref:Ubiquitin-like protease family profile domain-containing protein n=1 Tax=Vitis vinifera TaxID=29760 RepID=A0A438G5N2_VITVI|nr:hypothetical protein CK203_063103 [Vitis vinifera]
MFFHGIDQSYYTWYWHGEVAPSGPPTTRVEHYDKVQFDDVGSTIEMVQAAQEDCKNDPESFQRLLKDAEKPLYPGCRNFTKFSALIKLYNLKARFGWSDKSFSELLEMLGNMLPVNNELPLSMYEAKKTLNTLGMEYEKIHACPNDCILYRNELKDASSCPTCGTSRWKTDKTGTKKKKGVPAKVMWYFPPVPRFRRMFQSVKIAKELIWHAEERDFDGKMRHPSDSPSWKLVDHRWPEFSSEPRNLRLAISADDINPHSSLSPRQPGNDIDIYLAPLIEDLKTLWEVGVQAYDAHQREFFTLRAVLLWTISDFPAYGNLSGCTVKGYFGCPICGEETYSRRLKHGKKNSYTGHRRFLPCNHPFRKQKKAFDGKTKDGLNCRLDLVDMGLRSELAPKFESKRTYLPPACYSLSKMEKKVFCQTLSQLKVPYGYCSNLRNLVSMEDLKLYGLKSHDYHTLMQQLLPVSLRSILPKHVRNAICRLSSFFNTLCSKVVDVPTLDELQNEVVVTLCLFEKYFPPSFFDIMVHLTVHLVREVRLCGPVYLRWMYPFESTSNIDQKLGASIFGGHTMKVDSNLWLQAHHYVLENTTIIQPYVEDHMKWLKMKYPRQAKRQKWLQDEHMRTFTYWLRQKVEVAIGNEEPVSETLKWIAHGPSHYVFKYHGYVINGCHYHTKERDDLRATQNSGVKIVATTMQIASAKDKNPVFGELCFYGVITEIWDLDYTMFRIPIFKCDWVDNKNGIKVDDLGFTLVDFSKMAHKSDPFILASQAKQVFYVQDELDPRWSVVLSTPQQDFLERDEGDDLMDNSIEHHPVISSLPQVESFDAMDDSDAICMDLEQEEKPPTKRRCRGITRKSMIIKNRSKGVKLVIKYNPDGIYVGQASVHLTSFLGVLARTMVPIRYNSWRDVPIQVKNNLWDTIEASFTLDSKSRRNCMLTMGKCFRSFKNMLTVKYVIPFKDQPEDFREVQKERRKKHIYNHHLSRKGYAGLEDEMMATSGYTEIIDRSILWKKAMEKKDGTYDEVVIPVVEKIDKMLKESRESGRIFSGNNDILTEALGTPEYSGRVRAKGKHYTPHQYFHSMANSAMREFVKESQERQSKFEANILAQLSQMMPSTPQSDVSSSNVKQNQIVLPQAIEQPKCQVDDHLPIVQKANKVRKCQLAIGTKENVVAAGTIILECGVNFLVVVDASYEPNAPLPVPIPNQIKTIGEALGYQVLWPAQMVSLTTHPIQDSKKFKKQRNKETRLSSKDENPIDIKNFATLVGLLLKEGKVHAVNITKDVFGESSLVSKAGMGEASKESRSRVIANRLMNANHADFIFIPYNPSYHWVLVALETRTMIAYYLDSLEDQPSDDLKEIVNMALRIHPPQKHKSSKREPTWVVVGCPIQPGSVECGYYVMRYMRDIIADQGCLTSKFHGKKSYSKDELNEVRSEWVMLVTQLILSSV